RRLAQRTALSTLAAPVSLLECRNGGSVNPFGLRKPVHLAGMIGRTVCDCRSGSWEIGWSADFICGSRPRRVPVFGLRSNFGNAAEAICTRSRWPFLISIELDQQSMVYS